MIKDYYETLQLKKNATEQEIDEAFKIGVLKYYQPFNQKDKKSIPSFFTEIAEAYQVLSDPHKKALYDHHGYKKFTQGFKDKYGNQIGGYIFSGDSTEIFLNSCGFNKLFTKLTPEKDNFESLLSSEVLKKTFSPNPIIIEKKLTLHELYLGKNVEIEFEKTKISLNGITTEKVQQKK